MLEFMAIRSYMILFYQVCSGTTFSLIPSDQKFFADDYDPPEIYSANQIKKYDINMILAWLNFHF